MHFWPSDGEENGGLKPQCHLVFLLSGLCMDCGADPLVRSRPPGRLVRIPSDLILREKSGTRASRADQGVLPTNRVTAQFRRAAVDYRRNACSSVSIAAKKSRKARDFAF